MNANMSHDAKLPRKKVAYIGGNQNLVKHLKNRHPQWTFLPEGTVRFPKMQPCVVFVDHKHMSHQVFQRARKYLSAEGGAMPIVYVNSTNINAIEKEMLEGYTCLREKMTLASA